MFLLAFLRTQIEITNHPDVESFPSFPIGNFTEVDNRPEYKILYSPNNDEVIINVMENLVTRLQDGPHGNLNLSSKLFSPLFL